MDDDPLLRQINEIQDFEREEKLSLNSQSNVVKKEPTAFEALDAAIEEKMQARADSEAKGTTTQAEVKSVEQDTTQQNAEIDTKQANTATAENRPAEQKSSSWNYAEYDAIIKNAETVNSTTRLVYFVFIMVGMFGDLGMLGDTINNIVKWSPYGAVKHIISSALQPGTWSSETSIYLLVTIGYALIFSVLGIKWFKWNSSK